MKAKAGGRVVAANVHSMTKMPKVSRIRQNAPGTAGDSNRATAQKSLALAFTTFTQAAGSLEKSYTHLQAEVERLHQELRRANAELEKTLEENARVRLSVARSGEPPLRNFGRERKRADTNH